MQRSLLIFQNCIKSEETLKNYTYYLDRFISYYKIKDYDAIVSIPQEKIQIMVEDYVMALKKRVNPNSVPTKIATAAIIDPIISNCPKSLGIIKIIFQFF